MNNIYYLYFILNTNFFINKYYSEYLTSYIYAYYMHFLLFILHNKYNTL